MQPQAFDSYASSYDSRFTQSLIGKEQRKQVWKILKKEVLHLPGALLELNCGTGEDAIYLEPLMTKHPFIFKCLCLLDSVFGKISFPANRSDHFLIFLQKN